MNVYSIDIQVAATAYIKAESEEQALEIATSLVNEGLEFSSRHQTIGDDVCMDGSQFRDLHDNDETTALSPAMTVIGTFNGQGVELVEEDIDVEESEDA